MTWAAVVVGGTAAIGGAISASSANKQAKRAAGGLDEAIAYARRNPGVFGEKIDFESISYSPLFREDPGFAGVAGDVIAGNQRNLPAATRLASDTNDAITQDSLDRINKLYPGFQDSFQQQTRNTDAFLRGEIPAEDREMITARRTEAQSLGGGGVNPQQVAADLGLTRMDLMDRGAASLTNNVNLWDAIDPIARQVSPQSLFVDVGQAISSAVAENQFAANFAQSERNAELGYAMSPDPQKAGLLNLMAARSGLQAANPQQNVFGAAVGAGLTAGVGAWGANQAASAFAARQNPQYVPTARSAPVYATPSDQAMKIQTLSGGTAAPPPYAGAYNPSTGQNFGQTGGFWSSFAGQPKR
jgi:hypothetical protein